MKKVNALVVDDEPLARARMKRLLTEAGCEVIGELANGLEFLEWLQAPPATDVIFLDIQMPGMSGMEALAEKETPIPVVFVTAFSEYAIRAFELAASDYLLKPVFKDRLGICLKRLEEKRIRPLNAEELRSLLPQPARVPIRAGNGEIYLALEQISHFQVEEARVWAHLGPVRHLTHWTSLLEVEEAFPQSGMLRIQRNVLLRPEAVKGQRPASGARIRVLVAPGFELTVSRTMTAKTRGRIRSVTG